VKKVELLLEAIAGMCYLSGGQLPRVSELFSLECENGATSARGLYVYNGFVVYLIRHHKAKRSTNREFYVARYLPAQASRVLFYYLVYIWPFVRMLRQERGDQDPSLNSSLLFCSDQTPDRPWTSHRLTAVLQKASSLVWGWTVNTQLCRQLAIAITEKHVKDVHQRFNRYDDKSPNADATVAFAWQSGHRPLQRANTYGLDGAFPTHLQPSLLRVYEWVSVCWHEFLQRPAAGSGSRISNGEDWLQVEPESPSHRRTPERDLSGDGLALHPLATNSESLLKRRSDHRTLESGDEPLQVTVATATEHWKQQSTASTHSPPSSPTMPDFQSSSDDLPTLSLAPNPQQTRKRKQASQKAPSQARQGTQDVQDKRRKTASDHSQRAVATRATGSGTEDSSQPLAASRPSALNQTPTNKGRSALAQQLSSDYDVDNWKDQFYNVFEYLPANRIAVCKHHQQGIVKSHLGAHLNKRHKECSWETRRDMVKAAQEDASLQQWADDPDQVIYPSPDAAPLPYLAVYHDGLQCTQCPYINRSTQRIREHCRRKHGWKGQARESRGRQLDAQPMWQTTSCQKLHGGGKFGRLFAVSADAQYVQKEREEIASDNSQ
jgi:hypothetical protein